VSFQNDDIAINTYIGAGSVITGDLKISGFVTVYGDIDGNLEATGKIIVGRDARIKGNIVAKSAIISGIVEGNITAPEHIQLFESAVVIGDLTTKRLELAENVIYHGHCISLSNEDEYNDAVQKWSDYITISSSAINSKMNTKIGVNL